MDKRLQRYTDENLRDIPCDPDGLRNYIAELEDSLKSTSDPFKQASLLGEIGVHYRSLGELLKAKDNILRALKIIENNQLGLKREIQQKIRLAHVLQWESRFQESNSLFESIISICRSNTDAKDYLDFALQHAGKNYFEQKMFQKALDFFEEALNLRIQRSAPIDQIESTKEAIARTKKLLSSV